MTMRACQQIPPPTQCLLRGLEADLFENELIGRLRHVAIALGYNMMLKGSSWLSVSLRRE